MSQLLYSPNKYIITPYSLRSALVYSWLKNVLKPHRVMLCKQNCHVPHVCVDAAISPLHQFLTIFAAEVPSLETGLLPFTVAEVKKQDTSNFLPLKTLTLYLKML